MTSGLAMCSDPQKSTVADCAPTIGYLFAISNGIHENIKFADAKAGVLITLNAGLIAGLYSTINGATFGAFVAGLSCSLLVVSVGFAFWVIWPRGDINRERGAGLVDAIRIAQTGETEFVRRMLSASQIDVAEELAIFVHDRSKIDEKKYRALRVALVLALIGWVLAFVYAFGVKAFPMIRTAEGSLPATLAVPPSCPTGVPG